METSARLRYLRQRDAAGNVPDANELVREADGTSFSPRGYLPPTNRGGPRLRRGSSADAGARRRYRIPEHLKVQPTDSEQERLRKRRRVKALKQKMKQAEQDAARDQSKNSWLAFQNKGAKRKAQRPSGIVCLMRTPLVVQRRKNHPTRPSRVWARPQVHGSLKNMRKESIFAAPTTVDGKVGVTGSGHDMTEFGEKKKYKISPPLP